VGDPSNLERLQWLFGGALDQMRALISSHAHTDQEVREAIAELFEKFSYVADPHTAIGYLGAKNRDHALFLATAHPAKFREVVEPIIGAPVPLPDPLAAALAQRKDVQRIRPVLGELAKLL
jgi:threonine synthase